MGLWVNRGMAPCVLNLGTRWKWVVSFTPRPLYPCGKISRYPSDRRLSVSQSRSGLDGKQRVSKLYEHQSQSERISNVCTPLWSTIFHSCFEWRDCISKIIFCKTRITLWWVVDCML